ATSICFYLFLFSLVQPRPPPLTLFPYTTLFRSATDRLMVEVLVVEHDRAVRQIGLVGDDGVEHLGEALGDGEGGDDLRGVVARRDRKSTRLNSSHVSISYAVFCLKKKKKTVQVI